eukprot:TRINITY_DN40470_c0_g1_i5.p3 TRINITY_DN40470_c0_g1~~TRINITY_DN40470_c0_g1_i5.p3  ORF type:complete len:106 (-),score=7.48 TRINITY_DN40470_c0_g1_i5:115-432(-)
MCRFTKDSQVKIPEANTWDTSAWELTNIGRIIQPVTRSFKNFHLLDGGSSSHQKWNMFITWVYHFYQLENDIYKNQIVPANHPLATAMLAYATSIKAEHPSLFAT